MLSFCEPSIQISQVHRLTDEIHTARLAARFGPALDGLAHVISGKRFTTTGTVPDGHGRRFLGWAAGPHWCLP